MKLTAKDIRSLTKTEVLCLPVLEGKKPELPKGVSLPAAVVRDFKGGFRKLRFVDPSAGVAQRVLLVGVGKPGDATPERLRRVAGLAVKACEGAEHGALTLWVSDALSKAAGGGAAAGQACAEGAVMASYRLQRFKSDKQAAKLKSVLVCGNGADFKRGVAGGRALGEANLYTRDLQDAPGNYMRPRDMAASARKLATRSTRIRCSVLTEAQMGKLGMGSLLSVSRGSEEPAFLVHLVHKPKGRSRGRIAIVGKGLTFDAGGISLKPPAKMDEMKYDMSGGAAVLGLFHALADIEVPFEVHGLVPTSENLPDGKANKPGDIVTAMNGKTIEVLNTDAEGRLILADALAYAAKKVKPDTMIDMATLTGAVIVALGHELSGVISESDDLVKALVAAGEDSGEPVWRLPLLDCHKDHVKGKIGDLRNINSGQGAGSTAGAAFLSSFVGDVEWAHLDIAGTAWGSENRDYVGGPGGTGVGVRLLMQYFQNRK